MKYLVCIIATSIFIFGQSNVPIEFNIIGDKASITVRNLNFERHYFAKLDGFDLASKKKFFLFDLKALISEKYLLDKDSIYSMEEFISFKFRSKKVLEDTRNLISFMTNKKLNYELSLTVYSISNSGEDKKLHLKKPEKYKYETCLTKQISVDCYNKTEFLQVKNSQTTLDKTNFYLTKKISNQYSLKLRSVALTLIPDAFGQVDIIILKNLHEHLGYKNIVRRGYSRFTPEIEHSYVPLKGSRMFISLSNKKDFEVEICLLGNCVEQDNFYYFLTTKNKFFIFGDFVISESETARLAFEIEVHKYISPKEIIDTTRFEGIWGN